MSYRPKVIKCRLKTGGKSIAELQERYEGEGLTHGDLENIQQANKLFDGIVLFLSQWDYDKHKSYHLYEWEEEHDEKIMMAIYYLEQADPNTQYKDKLEDFQKDWKTEEYDPGCAFCFDPQDVEEIEVIQEEQK